jgi:acyl-CoA synthetase (AMP-forming)/AMP-acid ligase II
MQNFSQRLLEQLDHYPEKVILHLQRTGHADAHVTFHELISQSAKYAKTLNQRGVVPGEVVVLILQHSLDLIYAYFGTILLGAVPSIMPFLTEKLLPEKYRHDLSALIEITKPAAIITYREFETEIESFLEKGTIKTIVLSEEFEEWENAAIGAKDLWGIQKDPEDIVLLQHSSGTTGLQKGVALSHAAVFNHLDSYQKAINLGENDVIVSWLPLYHDMGLIASFLMPVLTGTPLVLMSPFDWVRAPHKLMRAISDYRGTLCWLPNFAYNFCAKKIRETDMLGVELSSLRALINCSEPMRYESHQMFLKRFRDYGFRDSALATSYAMAENVFAVTQDGIGKAVTYDQIDLEKFQQEKIAEPARAGNLNAVMVSAGAPIENNLIKIISDQGEDLPERHLGEILIKSNSMLTEYYLRPDDTRKSFIDGWFKTGDLGYLANGELYISGRKKDLIIVGGKNIYPQDIETIVMEVNGVHPGRAVAFGIYNDEKGTEDVVVVAEIEPDFAERENSIAEEIRKKVTQGTAVALRHVFLVDEMWLIKTSSGKTARAANKLKYQKEVLKTDVG